jgi:hypothetical protein
MEEEQPAALVVTAKADPILKTVSKYKRGQDVDYKVTTYSVYIYEQKIKDKKLRGNFQKLQKQFGGLAYNAAQSEMLLPEGHGFLEVEGMEKTYKVTQDQLRKEVDITTDKKVSMGLFLFTAGIRA